MHSSDVSSKLLKDYRDSLFFPDTAIINYYGMPGGDSKRWEVGGLKYVRSLEVNFVLPAGEI